MRIRMLSMVKHGRRLVMLALCGLLLACTTEGAQGHRQYSGASDSGVTFREMMGDFCPPAQAMKGNC